MNLAQPRTAHLVDGQALGERARLLEFALPDGQALGFSGGQYIIVNTGIALPDGKTVKRAYSLVSSDEEQRRFTLNVCRVGRGSHFMHDIPVGSELPFSGPWGKWHGTAAEPGPTWVLATDTGITATLGLLRSRGFRSRLAETSVIWCVESPSAFIPLDTVSRWIPEACGKFTVETIPAIGAPERADTARALVRAALGEDPAPRNVYLAGDGRTLVPARDEWLAAGIPAERIRMECFFNSPPKQS